MTILSNFKKGIAALAVSAMAFTMIPSLAFASMDFTDAADIPTWATEAISELVALDVLSGNADGSFAPARQLNRAEVAKIITLASGVDFDTAGGEHFPDVNSGAWYFDYVETMYNYGWIDGYPDGMFRPGNGINRAEIAKMVVNALELDLDTTGAPHFDDVSSSDWFFDYVETMYNFDIMRGYADGTFGASNPVNRAETAKIVYDGLLAVAMPWGPAEGTLEVYLSNETPRGTNVPFNATSVPFTTIELAASDDSDVEVSSLTFTRLGLGDNDDFKNVWMEIDGFKVGNDKSINNDDIVELRFNPPIVVPAGQTLVADIVASSKSTLTDKNVGHHNRIALVSADDVASTAMNVVGDFPIEGEEMEIADYQVSQIDFGNLASNTTLDVGANFVEIGKFRMLNESTTNKDIELRALTFKNDGTAELENILENVALYIGGEQVSAESIIDGDYITFRLDNGVTGGYIIEDGDSRIFSMRADIVSAEKNDTINFKIDNFEDLVAIEIGTAFGVKATSDSYNDGEAGAGTCVDADAEDNCARLAVYSIDSGDINVSRDGSSLGNQQYAPGSNDVVAMTARIIVDQPLLVDGVTLTATYLGTTTLDIDGANAAFSNFRLFLNDSLVDSENLLADVAAGSAELVYDTTFEIAGTSILKLVLNIKDAAPTGASIEFDLAATAFKSPEYISTGDQVPTDQMLGSASGSLVEVSESVLNITRTDGFSTGETIVAGLDDVTFLKFVLENNDSGDVQVTSLSIRGTGTDAAASYGNYTAQVFIDGQQDGGSKNLSTAVATLGEATFNDLTAIIPSAGQKEFTLVVATSEVLADGEVAGTPIIPAVLAVAQIDTVTLAGTNGTVTIDGMAAPYLTSPTAVAILFQSTYAAVYAAATPSVLLTNPAGADLVFTAAVAGTASPTPVIVNAAFPADFAGTLVNTQANVVAAAAIPAVAAGGADNMQFDVTAVGADNVENAQTVVTNNSGVAVTALAPLLGINFNLIQSGTLTVSALDSIASDIIVAGSDDIEILKIRLVADDDEVQISDFYFRNDDFAAGVNEFGSRGAFKLYNEAGQMMQERRMDTNDDTLHFQLENQNRISVPKDGSTFVTIKLDLGDIDAVAASGQTLKLFLNKTVGTEAIANFGIKALTGATGTDITPVDFGIAEGTDFVAYRSRLSINRVAPTSTALVNGDRQELFQFSVTADAAGAIKLDTITLEVTLDDADAGGTLDMAVATVEDVTDSTKVYTPGSLVGGTTAVDFAGLLFEAGETKTFALYATVSGSAEDDSISTTIADTDTYGVGAAIAWEDESDSTAADLTNGYLVNPDKTATVITK